MKRKTIRLYIGLSTALFLAPVVLQAQYTEQVCSTVWVPASSPNAQAGDTILTRNNGSLGPAVAVNGAIGGWFSHAGMNAGVVSGTNTWIHNTMDGKQVKTNNVKLKVLWGLISKELPFVKSIVGSSLENGLPGITTETMDRACGYRPSTAHSNEIRESFSCASNSVLVKPVNESVYRPLVLKALDKMKTMKGYYRLFAWSYGESFPEVPGDSTSDLIAQLPFNTALVSGKGNMCSGTVWHAYKHSGLLLPKQSFPAAARSAAAYAVHAWAKNNMIEENGWLATAVNGVLTGFYPSDAANQLTNCMVTNRCDDRTDRWKSDVNGQGTTTSVGPDTLLPYTYLTPANARPGKQSNTHVLSRVEPLQKTGGYYGTQCKTIYCSNGICYGD